MQFIWVTDCGDCGLAASHSSKDIPSLAYWLFASPQLNSVRWCCRVALSAKTIPDSKVRLPQRGVPKLTTRITYTAQKAGQNVSKCKNSHQLFYASSDRWIKTQAVKKKKAVKLTYSAECSQSTLRFPSFSHTETYLEFLKSEIHKQWAWKANLFVR